MSPDAPLFPVWRLSRLRMATDGAGVTALVCAQGCPLDCRYCINRQSKTFDGGTKVTPEQLYGLVKKDSLYYSATGGGVTFGGGEPLLHADFIAAFRAIIPEEWRIYAETSLYVPEACVRTAAKAVDRFFVDVKDTDPQIYRGYTGADNGSVLENLALLAELAGPDRITVRLPLIPGYNTEEDRDRSRKLLLDMGLNDFDAFTYRLPERTE
ncbi:MAG: radical SAM protein [Clostridia bacterium]|nr:radical SAM protein [Clostridia bacterium]